MSANCSELRFQPAFTDVKYVGVSILTQSQLAACGGDVSDDHIFLFHHGSIASGGQPAQEITILINIIANDQGMDS